MALPVSDIYQMKIQNPHATMPLIIPVLVLCNTPDEDLYRNIRHNSGLDLEWVSFAKEHDEIAVLVGGGPSVADCIEEIRELQLNGATVFAMNAAYTYLRNHGIYADYQVIADAKPETATLVDKRAACHLIASQVDPATMNAVLASGKPILWHLGIDGMEDCFPEARRKRGGYSLVGGGAAVGNSATCLAYVMGFRTIHCFGYDSSHRGEASHAYRQPMNDFIPTIEVTWAGKSYVSSVAMKAQAEKFQITANGLKQRGCEVIVHGDGLLPAMYNTPVTDMTEQDKYRLMWQTGMYRDVSPGEVLVPFYLTLVKPKGLIVDFGCGTGRASLALHKVGHEVFLIDFADNCRDAEARELPFLEWDLSNPIPIQADYGICTDVMEHLPEKYVRATITNIMSSARSVFFQISTIPDVGGQIIGQSLHLTVQPHEWWRDRFTRLGYHVQWEDKGDIASLFLITRDKETPCP